MGLISVLIWKGDFFLELTTVRESKDLLRVLVCKDPPGVWMDWEKRFLVFMKNK